MTGTDIQSSKSANCSTKKLLVIDHCKKEIKFEQQQMGRVVETLQSSLLSINVATSTLWTQSKDFHCHEKKLGLPGRSFKHVKYIF